MSTIITPRLVATPVAEFRADTWLEMRLIDKRARQGFLSPDEAALLSAVTERNTKRDEAEEQERAAAQVLHFSDEPALPLREDDVDKLAEEWQHRGRVRPSTNFHD